MLEDLGRIAYEGYVEASHGKSLISGADLPGWSSLKGDIKGAWVNAACAVSDRVRKQFVAILSEGLVKE